MSEKAPQATFSNELGQRIQRQIELENIDPCLAEDVEQGPLLMLGDERLHRRER